MLDSAEYFLKSKTLAPSSIRLPFKHIEVIDARFDTSKLGFELKKWYSYISPEDFRKVKLRGGVAKAIQEYYNDYYQLCLSDTANELLIVLKNLWIDNLPTSEFKSNTDPDMIWEAYQNIYVKVEYYLKKETAYYPLKRIDTVYQLTEQNIHSEALNFKKNNLSFFLFTLKSLIETYDFAALIDKSGLRTRLTLTSIDSFNNKRYQLPILTAGKAKPGIYFTGKDYINNTPAADSGYVVDRKNRLFRKEDKKTEIPYLVHVTETGSHTQGSQKVVIQREGNAVEFFIVSGVYLSKAVAGSMLGIIPDRRFGGTQELEQLKFHLGGGAKLHVILTPRQINMETGELY